MDTSRKAELVDALLAYGLNEYEGRAYLALLQHGPAVAGDISRRSGIPRPRVYDTLQRLIESSLVAENGGSPRSYSPLPLDDFLMRMTSLFRRRQEILRDGLAESTGDNRNDGVFHVHDEVPILRQCEDLIEAATRHLLVMASGIEITALTRPLRDAGERHVIIEGTMFGPGDLPDSASLAASQSSHNRTEHGGRRLTIIRDGEELLVAEIGGTNRPYGVRSRNTLLVDLARPAVAEGGSRISTGSAAFIG